MRRFVSLLALTSALPVGAQKTNCPSRDGFFASGDFPKLATLIDLCHDDPAALAELLRRSPLAALAPSFAVDQRGAAAQSPLLRPREDREGLQSFQAGGFREAASGAPFMGRRVGLKKGASGGGGGGGLMTAAAAASNLPIVTAHGMGDSCYNLGMKQLTKKAGDEMGVYAVCVPTGDGRVADTVNGFFLNMDASVDAFAAKVRADPELSDGFNAMGLSQGNNVIRGYMAKYNDPPVATFMSICGINAGVGMIPNCSPEGPGGLACEALSAVLAKAAYHPKTQEALFQADYYRDPAVVDSASYKAYSQLAQWNGEGSQGANQTMKENTLKTAQLVMVLGTLDTVVWPRAGEWWGAPDPKDPWAALQTMNQTRWYTEDSFGLRTLDEAGKVFFEAFEGNHLAFTQEELTGWLHKYFGTPASSIPKRQTPQ